MINVTSTSALDIVDAITLAENRCTALFLTLVSVANLLIMLNRNFVQTDDSLNDSEETNYNLVLECKSTNQERG